MMDVDAAIKRLRCEHSNKQGETFAGPGESLTAFWRCPDCDLRWATTIAAISALNVKQEKIEDA